MKKILIINTVGFGYEGISNVILNYASNMKKNDIQFYFLAFKGNNESVLEKLKIIGDVIVINRRKAVVNYIIELNKLLKIGFNVVHIHGNSGTMALETMLCKMNKVRKVIIHNHSMNTSHPVLNSILKHIAIRQADVCLSCSESAGKWLYGNRPFIVLNNGIDLNRFAFNESVRSDVRKEFNIDNDKVIGHVGYFEPLKNHDFLIDVFSAYHAVCRKSKLLLVGDGKLKNDIINKVDKLGLSSDVIILQRRIDIERIYQAMDVFVFPSLSEGLGLVAIEAQMAGLPVLASEMIPNDVACTPVYKTKKLNESAEEWGKAIQHMLNSSYERREDDNDIRKMLSCKGFDINSNVSRLYDIYVESV